MLLLFAQIFLSLLFLIISAEILINSSSKLARKIGISPLIIGTTIVALGTSLPELVVSLVAVVEKQPKIAIANIIGSNIANITLIFGVAILGGNLRVGTTKTQINNLVLLFVTILFTLACFLFEKIPSFLSLFWILIYFVFWVWEFLAGVHGREGEDKKWFQEEVKKQEKQNFGDVFLFPLGLAGLIFSGDFFVKKIAFLAEILGISQSFLGLTLVALGTSLPELATSLAGVFKKEAKMVIGNILGSNVFNLFFIGGIISLISPVSFRSWGPLLFLFFSAIFGFFVIILNKGRVVGRLWGFLLCSFYLFWIFYLF